MIAQPSRPQVLARHQCPGQLPGNWRVYTTTGPTLRILVECHGDDTALAYPVPCCPGCGKRNSQIVA